MGNNNEQLAKNLLHDFDWLRRIEGLNLYCGEVLCVASRPKREKWNTREVYQFSLSPSFSRLEANHVFKGKEVLEVDVAFLARWQYHRKRFSIKTFEKLAKKGIGPAKSYRSMDLAKRVSKLETRFEELKDLFHSGLKDERVLVPLDNINEEGVYKQLLFLFGKRKAVLVLEHFPKTINFEVLWESVLALTPEKGISELNQLLTPQGLSSHGYRKTLRGLLKKSDHDALRKIIFEIYETQKSKPYNFLSDKNKQAVAVTLLFGKHGRRVLEYDWDAVESLLTHPDPERLIEVLLATKGEEVDARSLIELAQISLKGKYIRLGVPVIGSLFSFKSKRSLHKYLDVIEQHPDLPVREDEWFIRLFQTGISWVGNLALALIAPQKDRIASTFFSLTSPILQESFPFLEKEILAWDHPSLEESQRPSEWESVADTLVLSNSAIDAYLYYRHLLGDGFTFSAAVLSPTKLAEKEAKQIEHIKKRIQEGSGDLNPYLTRLKKLEDPEAFDKRLKNLVKNAMNTFERSTLRMKDESLENVLSRFASTALSQILDMKIEKAVPFSLLNAFHLVSAEYVDLPLLNRFFRTIIKGTTTYEWPENIAYLETLKIDADKWVQGFDVQEGGFRFYTEHDPLEALKMGNYFKTCLSLQNMNAYSALVNVVDANKHIVYARKNDGSVAARKLIAINEHEELIGYHTYVQGDDEDVHKGINDAIRNFAQRCGLVLSSRGEPKTITTQRWYNDGTESWDSKVQEFQNDGVLSESYFVNAALSKDIKKLSHVVEHGYWPWQIRAEEELRNIKNQNMFVGKSFTEINEILEYENGNVELVVDHFLKFRGSVKEKNRWDEDSLMRCDISFASLSVGKLLPMFEKYWSLSDVNQIECIVEDHHDCISHFVQSGVEIFLAAHLRGEDLSSVEKWVLHKEKSLRKIALTLFSEIPASSPKSLRQSLKRVEDADEIRLNVLALGLCGDKQDIPGIKNRFLAAVDNSAFAASLIRLGEKESVEKYWEWDLEDISPESIFVGRYFRGHSSFAKLRTLIVSTKDPEEKETLLEKWIQWGQGLDGFSEVSAKHLRLEKRVQTLERVGAYYHRDDLEQTPLLASGYTYRLLKDINESKEEDRKKQALFTILRDGKRIRCAMYTSRNKVVYSLEDIKPLLKLSHTDPVKRPLSMGCIPVHPKGDTLLSVRSLATKDPYERKILNRLMDAIIESHSPLIWRVLSDVCRSVLVEDAEVFLEQNIQRLDFSYYSLKEYLGETCEAGMASYQLTRKLKPYLKQMKK